MVIEHTEYIFFKYINFKWITLISWKLNKKGYIAKHGGEKLGVYPTLEEAYAVYASAKENKIKVYDVEDDFDLIFEDLDKLKTDNIYIITGMKPYKKIKEFFKKGDNNE